MEGLTKAFKSFGVTEMEKKDKNLRFEKENVIFQS